MNPDSSLSTPSHGSEMFASFPPDAALKLLRAGYEAQQLFMSEGIEPATPHEVFDVLLAAVLDVASISAHLNEIGGCCIGEILDDGEQNEMQEMQTRPPSARSLRIVSTRNIEPAELSFITTDSWQASLQAGSGELFIVGGMVMIPLFSGSVMLGVLGVTKRDGDFSEDFISTFTNKDFIALLEPVTSACAVILGGFRRRQRREQKLAQLRAANEHSHRNEQFLRSLVDSSTSYVIRTDLAGRYTYINKAFTDHFGFFGKVIGMDSLPTMHPDDAEICSETVRYCLENVGKMKSVILRKPQADGSYLETEWEFIVVCDTDGNPLEIQSVGRDISARRQAEAALVASEERYRSVFDSSPIPKLIYNTKTLEIIDANSAAASLYGYSDEEFSGLSMKDLLLENEVPRLMATLEAETLASSKIVPSGSVEDSAGKIQYFPTLQTWQHRRKDGMEIFVEGASQQMPMFGVTVHLAAMVNVSEREALSRQIEEQEHFLSQILALVPGAVSVFDIAEQRNVYVSQGINDLYGYTVDEMNAFGENLLLQVMHPDDYPRITQELARLFAGEIDDLNIVYRMKHKRGDWIWVLGHDIVFKRNADGSPLQILGMLTDITLIKEAEEQALQFNEELDANVRERTRRLVELNREKDELLNIAAHDLKNPLQGIALSTSLALRHLDAGNTAKVVDILKSVDRTTTNAVGIITMFLDANAIDSGQFRLAIGRVPTSFVTEVAESYRLRAKEKSMTLHLTEILPEHSAQTDLQEQTQAESSMESSMESSIAADPNALRQVLENLISNALKYSPLGASIWIRVSTQASWQLVRIEVQDEGPGISDKDKARMFKKFERLSARPTGGESSTGLGLNIAKKLTEAMDGQLWCESELGKGATFVVELPLVPVGEPRLGD
jgi:PAS domain S-box-containing protein